MMKKLHLISLIILRLVGKYTKRLSGRLYLFVGMLSIIALVGFGKVGTNFYSPVEVSEGLIGSYTTANLPGAVTNLISEPLIVMDKMGYPQPKLASGWQVNSQANTYTFKLRSNLYWNDGSKLRSSDIHFQLPGVEIKYPDDQTIEFKLSDSFSPFPSLLTSPVLKKGTLIGVGKYRVGTEQKSGEIITKLIFSPRSGLSGEERTGLPKFSIRFYPDEKTAKTAFELGEIDILIGTSDEKNKKSWGSMNKFLSAQVKRKRLDNFNRIAAVFFNTKDAVLSDKNLRKALTAATPIVENEERAKSPVPKNSWAFNDSVKDLGGDSNAAKTYLDKVRSGKDKTITLTTVPALATLGERIISSWKTLGLSAILRVESGIPQNFEALLILQSIPADPDQYTLWHSTQSKTNLSKYVSPRVDKDLEDGRKTANHQDRKEKYLDFQKVLIDDAPAVFLYFPKVNVIYRSKAEGTLNKVLPLQYPQAS